MRTIKIALLIIALCFADNLFAQTKATLSGNTYTQVPNYELIPNFQFKDLDGTTHTKIYQVTKSKKLFYFTGKLTKTGKPQRKYFTLYY